MGGGGLVSDWPRRRGAPGANRRNMTPPPKNPRTGRSNRGTTRPLHAALIEEALILMLPPEEREARRGFAVISPSLRREHDQRRDAVARRGASRGSPERGPDDGRGEPG